MIVRGLLPSPFLLDESEESFGILAATKGRVTSLKFIVMGELIESTFNWDTADGDDDTDILFSICCFTGICIFD